MSMPEKETELILESRVNNLERGRMNVIQVKKKRKKKKNLEKDILAPVCCRHFWWYTSEALMGRRSGRCWREYFCAWKEGTWGLEDLNLKIYYWISDFITLCFILGNWPANMETITKWSTLIPFLIQEETEVIQEWQALYEPHSSLQKMFRILTLPSGSENVIYDVPYKN